MANVQEHKPAELLHPRAGQLISDMMIGVMHVMRDVYLPDMRLGEALDIIVVGMAVFHAHVTGKPLTAHKLALLLDTPRRTVERRLRKLEQHGFVKKHGRTYEMHERIRETPGLEQGHQRMIQLICMTAAELAKTRTLVS